MRDRKCQSQVLLSSSEDEDAAERTSARRKTASRDRLSTKKTVSADPLTAPLNTGRQTSSGVDLLPSVEGNTAQTHPSNRLGPCKPGQQNTSWDGPKPTQTSPGGTSMRSSTNGCFLSDTDTLRASSGVPLPYQNTTGHQNGQSGVDSTRSRASCSATVSSSHHRKLERKPWEIGLVNIGPVEAASAPCPSSSSVSRWRDGISASTPSLVGSTRNSGIETVV